MCQFVSGWIFYYSNLNSNFNYAGCRYAVSAICVVTLIAKHQ